MDSMPQDTRNLDSPDGIAAEGERLYAERHKARLEASNRGEYVAINVLKGDAYVGKFPEEALTKARREAPNGVFHLIRIGSPGAFRSSFHRATRHEFWSGSLRLAR